MTRVDYIIIAEPFLKRTYEIHKPDCNFIDYAYIMYNWVMLFGKEEFIFNNLN